MQVKRNMGLAVKYMRWMLWGLLIIPGSARAEIKLFTLDKDTDVSLSGEITARNTFENWFDPSASLYYGHAFGRDVLKSIYKDSAAGDHFYVEFKAQF